MHTCAKGNTKNYTCTCSVHLDKKNYGETHNAHCTKQIEQEVMLTMCRSHFLMNTNTINNFALQVTTLEYKATSQCKKKLT